MIQNSLYIKSIAYLKDEPEDRPKLLLLGRSNVGKSSFINAVTNRKNLARTSANPGKTILLNYYLINDSFYFVDAPGYGYAKRSKEQRDEFLKMLDRFLHQANNLKAVILLVDFKVGPTKDDLLMFNFLKTLGKEIILVLTKADQIRSTHQIKRLKEIKTTINLDNMYVVSNLKNTGIDEIRNKILMLMRENIDE